MKRKDKMTLFNYAKKQYRKAFDLELEFKYMSKRELYNLIKQHSHSIMCEWFYCCNGLYENCWQELYAEGVWHMSQAKVNEAIKSVIDLLATACRRDKRILYCELDNRVDVIIIARDIVKADYLITFTNEEL